MIITDAFCEQFHTNNFPNNYININNPISRMLLAYNGVYLSDE